MTAVRVWFSGARLYVCSTRGILASYPAVSGRAARDDIMGGLRFGYGVTDQGKKDSGPLPAGDYKLRLGDARTYEHTGKTYLGAVFVGITELSYRKGKEVLDDHDKAWGRLDGKPGRILPILATNGGTEYAMGRNRCWIHGSHFPGSIGCIDLTDYMNDFIAKLDQVVARRSDEIPLLVRYGLTPTGREGREFDPQGRDISGVA